MKFIVKLFPEITIKSKPVRKRFIQRLQSNLQIVLRRIEEKSTVRGQWDKILVEVPIENESTKKAIVDALGSTPGVAHFMEVNEYPLGSFQEVFELTKKAYAEKIAGKRFVVRVKRAGKHEFKSGDLERFVGGGLLQHTDASGVDLHNPEVKVQLEVRDQKLYIVENRYEGLGGFPMGSQEAVLSLISGGFDSTVSSYMTLKRGCKTHYCFFNLGGAAHETGVKQVSHYIWQRFGSSHRVQFITVPFEAVVAEILTSVHHSQMGVVLKRMMLRAASQVAERMGIYALVTGESIAQVSSQTLPNLAVIDSVTDKLVLRPLITADKQVIIDLSKQIGTHDFAKSMPEYCGVISDRPTTHARADRIKKEESAFDFSVLDQAIADARVMRIDKVAEEAIAEIEVETQQQIKSGEIIIDIRHPDEEEESPLELDGVRVLKIPFYSLETEFANLEADQEYLLYCPKGVMSQLHALYLKERGYSNIKIYRP
ncbi:tRNA uracil 4-sulfurtransferase ThiI [Motiliproteus sp. MSK22-1]|uniref:tRNA uracil 4-sulfurtransferase ThiI n=1 Tax=Motiliproteus sp. MSK22-1 TaxID=1897630 RepID=UPI0009787A84|nr:tRNA uracil 4-sulfurtransferase ThiI [Motiliproteus sp. MSK22-1]OMH28370.1 tRNA 4-thiouridine(8) synthase ThiI [Motiliproteus sp. MSK22-1]